MPQPFDPHKHGIFQRFLSDVDGVRVLDTRAWNTAVETGQHVGTCTVDGGYLLGLPTYQMGQTTWYGTRCTNDTCRHETAAPNAQVLRRSTRHGDMPQGAWDARLRALSKGGEQ